MHQELNFNIKIQNKITSAFSQFWDTESLGILPENPVNKVRILIAINRIRYEIELYRRRFLTILKTNKKS